MHNYSLAACDLLQRRLMFNVPSLPSFQSQALVAEQVAGVLGSPVGGDDPLMAAGLDSLGATELQQGLANALGVELPSTLVFDYPTINAMAEYLASKLSDTLPAGGGLSPVAATAALAYCVAGAAGAVAIVGAAGQHELRLPRHAVDASSRVPFARWDVSSPLITGDGTLPAQVRAAASWLLVCPNVRLPQVVVGGLSWPAQELLSFLS
jgi:hypothetical protein